MTTGVALALAGTCFVEPGVVLGCHRPAGYWRGACDAWASRSV